MLNFIHLSCVALWKLEFFSTYPKIRSTDTAMLLAYIGCRK